MSTVFKFILILYESFKCKVLIKKTDKLLVTEHKCLHQQVNNTETSGFVTTLRPKPLLAHYNIYFIYLLPSVEYDFRQQEGKFLHILKKLDKVEPSPVPAPAPAPKQEPEIVIAGKQEARKKTKKVKKKCFWWI